MRGPRFRTGGDVTAPMGGLEQANMAVEARQEAFLVAVEQVFGVRVVKVNTLNRKGKRMRSRRTGTFSSRPTTKRAIVTVHGDDTIDLFEGV